MSRFWNTRASRIKPYVAGEQPDNPAEWIKINTNENPYPPSPMVAKAIQGELGTDLRLYPNSDATVFVDAVCEQFNLERSQVFAGNGSDEILAFSFMAFWDSIRPVMAPAVSYSFYPVYADVFDISYKTIPMKNGIEIDCDAFIAGKGGVIIANPNAPTSITLSLDDIERIIKAHTDYVVLVDEAYVDYGGESAISLVPDYENLLVVRTLSKSYSLAGMRLGFAVGNPELIDGLRRVKNSFNSYTLDRLAIAAGAAAIRDREYFEKMRDRVLTTRERTATELSSLGFTMPKSSTNFLFVTHPEYVAGDIFRYLKERKILVRYFNKPGIDNYLRVTIGTDNEMDILLSALREMPEKMSI